MPTHPSYTPAHGAQPLVSFIVPTYNLPVDMLRESLDSIMDLSLTQEEREIIVIDDGSINSPLAALADVIDQIIYIRQPNKGAAAARNTGLGIAKGRYIQFVDGDDRLVRSGYEHCLDTIRFQEADMVVFRSSAKEQESMGTASDRGPMSGSDYLRHNNLRSCVWGYLFRRSLLGNLRFHEGITREDEEFTPQLMLRAEQLVDTDAVAYHYRKREGSVMEADDNRAKARRLDDLLTVLDTLTERLDRLPADDRAALQRRVDQLTMDYLVNIITYTRSARHLERGLLRLRRRGLYPLPTKHYTNKYRLFATMMNNKAGRKVLLYSIPLVVR